MKKYTTLVLVLFFFAGNLLAQIGSVDTTYYKGMGSIEQMFDVLVMQDSSIIVAGAFKAQNQRTINYINKLKPDGSNDYSFNPGTGLNSWGRVLRRQSDGKIIVGGDFTTYNGTSRARLARIDSTGALDGTFTIGTGFNNSVFDVYVQADSKIVVTGSFTTFNGTTVGGIVRLNTDGSRDTSFHSGTGGNSEIHSVDRASDGTFIIGGNFTSFNGTTVNRIAKLNSDGSLNTTYNSGGAGANVIVYDALFLPNGKVIAAGNFTTYNGATASRIVRLKSNGTMDSTFTSGTGFNALVAGLTLETNGKILATGQFSAYNGTSLSRIARLDSAGTRDTTFMPGGGFDNLTYNSIVAPDNKIYVVGGYYRFDNRLRLFLTRLNTNGSIDPTFWSESKLNNSVEDAAFQSNGKLIIGGNFTYFNNTSLNRIARMNSDGTMDTTFQSGTGANSAIRAVYVLSNDKILIGGDFTSYNGTSINRIARLNSNGSLDTSFHIGTGANASVYALSANYNGKIYAGGNFTSINGTAKNRLVGLNSDGSIDASFNIGTGCDGIVYDIKVQSDSKLLVGGAFTSYNSITYNRLLRLDTLAAVDGTFTIGTGANNDVRCIAFDKNGKVFIGGGFTTYNGASRTRLVKLQASGLLDSTFNANIYHGAGTSVFVNSILPYNNCVLAGGNFDYINSVYNSSYGAMDSVGGVTSYITTGSGVSASGAYIPVLLRDTFTQRILVGGTMVTLHQLYLGFSFIGLKGGFDYGVSGIDSVQPPVFVCRGEPTVVWFKNMRTFNKGNLFTVQMSDSSGSFTSATTIGTKTAPGVAGWDSVTVTIPTNTLLSTHYKVRVLASNPLYTSSSSGYFTINGNPCAPEQIEPQIACSDTPHIFTFTPVYAGMGGNQVEWSLHSNFDTSYIITSGASIQHTVNSRDIDTIWVRSRVSTTHAVSSAIYTTANNLYILALEPYVPTDTVCPGNFIQIYIDSTQTGIRYDLFYDTILLSNTYGNHSRISLTTDTITSTSNFYIIATDTITGCSVQLEPEIEIYVAPLVGLPTFTEGDTLLMQDSTSCYQATATNAKLIFYQIWQGGAQIGRYTGCVSNVKSSFTVQAVAVSTHQCNVTSAKLEVDVEEPSMKYYFEDDRDFTPTWDALGPICEDDFDFDDNDYGSGRVYSFAFSQKESSNPDPYVFYAGTPFGGLWRSEDGGDNWDDWSDGLQAVSGLCSVADIAIDYTVADDAPTIYVATGIANTNYTTIDELEEDGFSPWRDIPSTGIYRSVDGGATFSPLPFLNYQLEGNGYINKLLLKPVSPNNDNLFVATSDGLYVSQNNGNDFDLKINNTSLYTVEISPTDNNRIYASGNDLFVSHDGGVSFDPLTLPTGLNINTYAQKQILVKVKKINIGGSVYVDQIYLYIFLRNNPTYITKLYWTNWDGVSNITWQEITNNPFASPAADCFNSDGNVDAYRGKMAINPDENTTEIYLGNCTTYKGVFTSGNWSWSQATNYGHGPTSANNDAHADIQALEFIPATNDVLVGTDGGVFHIDGDSPYDVIELNRGLNLRLVMHMGISRDNPERYVFGAWDNGSHNHTENGWGARLCTGDGGDNHVYDYSNQNYFISGCTGQGELARYYTGGTLPDNLNLFNCDEDESGVLMKQDPDNPDLFYKLQGNLIGILRDKTNPATHTWSYLGLASVTELQTLYGLNLNGEAMYSLDVTRNYNGNKYCYMATHNRWKSYLFVNRDFQNTIDNARAAPNCQQMVSDFQSSDWEAIDLPSNAPDYMKDFPWGTANTQNLSAYSVTGIATSDHDPNIVWLCYSHNDRYWSDGSIEQNHEFIVLKGVYNGTDWDWTTDQNGLPGYIQCTGIIYEKGSNDGLYLATKQGIFYKNAVNGWVPFNEGLPRVMVTDLDINYCSGTIKVATYGRGIHECQLYHDEANTKAYTLADDETWNTNREIGADIIVPNGVTLIITGNITINMAKGTYIIVEPGGKLIVADEAKVSNLCDMWGGIIVKGNPNEPQTITGTTSNQGYVVLDACTLQHAYEAVRLWDPDDETDLGTGGIVQAVNTTFLNNRRSAEFMQYHDLQLSFFPPVITEEPNPSFFSNCKFITNDSHRPAHPFHAFVTAWSVAPLHLWGCTFENNHTITTSTKDYELGDGIRTIDAGIIVEDFITEIGDRVQTKFKHLQHGVNVMSGFFPYPARVEHAEFDNCLRGIRNEGVDLATFVGNNFKMASAENPAQITPVNGMIQFPTVEGIILHGEMTGYTVEQNSFELDNNDPSSLEHFTIGIRTDGTGVTDNRIYNNTFNNLHLGNLGNRRNRFDDDLQGIHTGVSYECNTNTDNVYYDFTVVEPDMNDPQYEATGIRRNQGLISLPAGNTFSGINIDERDFGDYTEKDVNYYHANTTTNPSPGFHTDNVIPIKINIDNACETNFEFGGLTMPGEEHVGGLSFTGYSTAFSANKVSYTLYHNKFVALIDGGNTQQRVLFIDTNTNGKRLHDTLLTYSPNLSSVALQALVNKNVHDTIKYKVLKANPEGVTKAIIDDWVGIAAPVPQWMKDSVKAARSNLTYRSYLLDTVQYHSAQKDYAVQNALRLIAEDTAGIDLLLYRAWLDSADNAWAKRKKVNSYLYQGKLDTLETMLAHLDTTIVFTVPDSISFKNYKDYLLTYKDWILVDSAKLNRLNTGQLTELITIAGLNEHSKGSQIARSVMNFFYDSMYFTPPMLPDISFDKKGADEKKPEQIIAPVVDKTPPPVLKLYPNPAQNAVIIEFADIADRSTLIVVNAFGQVMDVKLLEGTVGKLELNTSAYLNGIYLARIEMAENKAVKSKFVIQK